MKNGNATGREQVSLLESAQKLAQLAEREAERIKVPMTICVLDVHGNIVLKHRMDGSALVSVEMAERKAFATIALKMKTEDISARAQPGQQFFVFSLAAGDRYWTDGGGVPFVIDGEVVAGLGVSGGSIEQDVAVAEAAIEAFNREA
jgi:uncharacterized protein GlcG (DUF336 family)